MQNIRSQFTLGTSNEDRLTSVSLIVFLFLAAMASTSFAADIAASVAPPVYQVACEVWKTDIPKGAGYDNKATDWPKMVGGKMQVGGSKKSICSSATMAVFMKSIEKMSGGRLSPEVEKVLNSDQFRNIWNSNGFGPAMLIDRLGGQAFKVSPSDAASGNLGSNTPKSGDFLKLVRGQKNGKEDGHIVVFREFKNGEVCYWSSQGTTEGADEKCEKLDKMETLGFARLPDPRVLMQSLEELGKTIDSDQIFAKAKGNSDTVVEFAPKGSGAIFQGSAIDTASKLPPGKMIGGAEKSCKDFDQSGSSPGRAPASLSGLSR